MLRWCVALFARENFSPATAASGLLIHECVHRALVCLIKISGKTRTGFRSNLGAVLEKTGKQAEVVIFWLVVVRGKEEESGLPAGGQDVGRGVQACPCVSRVKALSLFSHCSSHIRFGFDDDYAAARSFLFFMTNTNFTRSSFKGLERTLRKEETPEDRLEHRLQEGFDFSGFETLREMSRAPEEPDILPLSPPPPPRAELLWPLPPERQCLESPRDQRDPRVSKCRGAKSDFPWIRVDL